MVAAYDHDTTLPDKKFKPKWSARTSARLQVGLVGVAVSSALSPMATLETMTAPTQLYSTVRVLAATRWQPHHHQIDPYVSQNNNEMHHIT